MLVHSSHARRRTLRAEPCGLWRLQLQLRGLLRLHAITAKTIVHVWGCWLAVMATSMAVS